jgi:RNA polymerase sigma-70 factor (ECF subfamily)
MDASLQHTLIKDEVEDGRNEIRLWKLMLDGEKEGLDGLFRLYYAPLIDYGVKIVVSEEEVKDAIQELFLKLWRIREALTTPQSVKGYLLVSLRRILLREAERKRNRGERNRMYINNDFSAAFTKEDLIITDEIEQEQKEGLVQAINQLNGRQKETLYLRYYHGLTNQEIAEVMGINRQSVKNNLSRALANVRSTFKQFNLS